MQARARIQLSADELRQLRWLLGGLLTVLGVSTVAFMDVQAWLLMGLTIVASVLTTFRPTLPARVPRFVHVMAFPFIAAFFALDLWLRSELLPAMVRLDMLLLLYRALVYRQRRDDLQVIVLGLFLVVVAGVLTVSLGFAVQILAYTACSLLFLLVLTLHEASEAPALAVAAASKPDPAAKPATSRVPAWAAHVSWARLARRVAAATDWRVVALGGVLFVGVIAGTALLFLVIPRFQLESGMFLDRFITKKARTGFSDTIKFGDVTEILQDTSIALHVDVTDPGQIPLSPYWRMLVLNEYTNGTFRMSPELRAARFRHPRTGTTVYGGRFARRGTDTWRFYLEPGISRHMPLLARYQQLKFAEAQTYQAAEETGLLALTKDPVTMIAYQIVGFDLSRRLRDDPAGYYSGRPGAGARQPALNGADLADMEALVAEATGSAGAELDAEEFSTRVCAWLRERHSYSLSPRVPDGSGDPLVRWARSREAGHCELFAGSFVLLARAAGHPARVVTGFRGGTWNAYSNSFTVRNSDAHAWAEIYDQRTQSWLRADPLELPSAAQGSGAAAEAAIARRTDRSWTARLESLRVFWYRRIVSFDQQAQFNSFKAAKDATQSALQGSREWVQRLRDTVRNWLRSPWDVARAVRVALFATALLALYWAWRRLQPWLRFGRWRGGAARREDPVRREAGRWLRRLVIADVRGDEQLQLRRDLQRLRYGAPQTWPSAPAVFRRARLAARQRR